MKCEISLFTRLDERGATVSDVKCITHGIGMDPMMAQIEGAMCPLGYISHVEERFKHTSDELQRSLNTLDRTLETLQTRLEAIEDKLGLPE